MAQSRAKKKLFNIAYNIGASIVILGALFKLNHITIGPLNGSIVLGIGLVAEAIIFFLSAFETPEEDLDWSRVYPELADGVAVSSKKEEKKLGADGMLSQKLDNLLQEAKIDSNLMASLGSSMKNFQNAAEGLSAASESVASTNKYNEEMSKAALQMESLNNLYRIQVENSGKQTELNSAMVENTEKLQAQMAALATNLSSLNGVYGGMLSAMSK